MWQFLLVAAVAGSTGFFAKHLRATKADRSSAGETNGKRIENCDQRHREQEQVLSGSDHKEIEAVSADSVELQVSSPADLQSPVISLDDSVSIGEGIFRISSPESASGSEKAVELEQKLGLVDGAVRVGVEKRKGARGFSVCLKRRTGKSLAANKRGSCPSKGCSFGWELGLEMMYMMSARKSEISNLSTTMDEAVTVIKELKAELNRRESSKKLGKENREHNGIKFSSLHALDDGESPSSVLTEEREPELLEMDLLEAEFVSELQKLPWCTEEASCPHGMKQCFPELDLVNNGENELERQISNSYQFHGVNPSELDHKLSHLLIEQQENQIIELEFELQTALLKLNEKEAELQALKDRVRRLTELSLSAVTDDENEAHEGLEYTDKLDYNNMVGSESKRSVLGMKRSIDSELCGY